MRARCRAADGVVAVVLVIGRSPRGVMITLEMRRHQKSLGPTRPKVVPTEFPSLAAQELKVGTEDNWCLGIEPQEAW